MISRTFSVNPTKLTRRELMSLVEDLQEWSGDVLEKSEGPLTFECQILVKVTDNSGTTLMNRVLTN